MFVNPLLYIGRLLSGLYGQKGVMSLNKVCAQLARTHFGLALEK